MNQENTFRKPYAFEVWVGLVLCLVSTAMIHYAVGMTNHFYQWLFAFMILMYGYRSRKFSYPHTYLIWVSLLINLTTLAFVLRVFIGIGERSPFYWLKVPTLQKGATQKSLMSWLKPLSVEWQSSELTLLSIDFTLLQSFLLLGSALTYMIGLRLMTSVLGLLFLVFALPTLMTSEWEWLIPALMLAISGFYLQSEVKSVSGNELS